MKKLIKKLNLKSFLKEEKPIIIVFSLLLISITL